MRKYYAMRRESGVDWIEEIFTDLCYARYWLRLYGNDPDVYIENDYGTQWVYNPSTKSVVSSRQMTRKQWKKLMEKRRNEEKR